MTGLTTPVANPLGAGFVVLSLPLLEDLLEALDDKSHLLVVNLGGINGSLFVGVGSSFFSSIAFECNGLHLGCGGGALLQVDNVFWSF
jgi:hypothetical protein